MALLFNPLTIRAIRLKNRIAVSPMCEYSSKDGFANDWHLIHLGSRAVGGAALIISEATAVTPEGRITHADLGIWKDEHIPMLQRITSFIESQGAVPGMQLAHAGRKASRQIPWEGGKALTPVQQSWQTIAPSAIPFGDQDPVPVEMDIAAIRQLTLAFSSAAERAIRAGFKVIEIHAAHGYLINEFISPLSNHRKDTYGSSFENRIKLLLEIVDAVRNTVGQEVPLFVRISASDWTPGGFIVDEAVRLAAILKERTVDLVDCSSGGVSPAQKIETGPLYQVPFAEKIKKETGILTGAVGMITTVQQAEKILQNNQADLILMARQLLREPYFPLHAAKELAVDTKWPLQYERAKRMG